MDALLQTTGYVLTAVAILLLLGIGLAGCVLPVLPGHPLILVATLVAQLAIPGFHVAWYHWLILILLCIAGMIGDHLFTILGARRFGSTKAGLLGCLVGIIVGLFFPPFGLLWGPFVGALVAEIFISRETLAISLRSGWGAFLGTMAGLLFKIGIALLMITYVVILFVHQMA